MNIYYSFIHFKPFRISHIRIINNLGLFHIFMQETQYCASCDGNGIYEKKCRDCDEDGYCENGSCETCEGTGKIEGMWRVRDCPECNGHGYFKHKCDREGCDDGYIDVDCHEEDPHTWTLYKCSGCDFEVENRDDDETSAYALHQHRFHCDGED